MFDGNDGDQRQKPLAYAIINDKTKEDVSFFLRHEGVQLLSWDTKVHGYGAADHFMFALQQLTNPYLRFGGIFDRP